MTPEEQLKDKLQLLFRGLPHLVTKWIGIERVISTITKLFKEYVEAKLEHANLMGYISPTNLPSPNLQGDSEIICLKCLRQWQCICKHPQWTRSSSQVRKTQKEKKDDSK